MEAEDGMWGLVQDYGSGEDNEEPEPEYERRPDRRRRKERKERTRKKPGKKRSFPDFGVDDSDDDSEPDNQYNSRKVTRSKPRQEKPKPKPQRIREERSTYEPRNTAKKSRRVPSKSEDSDEDLLAGLSSDEDEKPLTRTKKSDYSYYQQKSDPKPITVSDKTYRDVFTGLASTQVANIWVGEEFLERAVRHVKKPKEVQKKEELRFRDFNHLYDRNNKSRQPKMINDKELRATMKLYSFRKRPEKQRLLQDWDKKEDGDYSSLIVILTYIRQSLNDGVFFDLLAEEEHILTTYIKYLETINDFATLESLYEHMQWDEEMMFLKIRKSLVRTRQVDKENPKRLNRRYRCHLENYRDIHQFLQRKKSLSAEADLIRMHMQLIDREKQVEELDREAELEDTSSSSSSSRGGRKNKRKGGFSQQKIFEKFPRPCIFGAPTCVFVRYLLFYHQYSDLDLMRSTVNAKLFSISKKSMLFLKLDARAEFHDWISVREYVPKTRGGRFDKKRGLYPIETFLEIISRYDPPESVKEDMVELIDDMEARFFVAKKNNCFDVAIISALKLGDEHKLRQIWDKVHQKLGKKKAEPYIRAIQKHIKTVREDKKNVVKQVKKKIVNIFRF